MFGSTVLDVAIGLAFAYFLSSIIVSFIDELLAQLFRWRAADLRAGIRNMLGDPDLANKVWNHSLIKSLAARAGRNPSYIPANVFSLALFDALAPGGNNPSGLTSIRAEAAKLPENSARSALLSIIDKSDGRIDDLRANVEDWFNGAMDRVSGAYKQRLMWVTILVSLFITFIFNVDTIALANSFWMEPGFRAALTGAGSTFASSDIPGASSLQDAIKALAQFALPIGWTSFPTNLIGWAQKLAGLLLTTLAVSVGAPFWFDVLKKVVNPRGSGPPPQAEKRV